MKPPIIETRHLFALIIIQKFYVFNSKYLKKYLPLQITEYEKKHTCMPAAEKGGSYQRRDNSMQSPIRETLNILVLLCHNHTEIALI